MSKANGQPPKPVPVKKLLEEALLLLPRVVNVAFRRYHPLTTEDDKARCEDRLRFRLCCDDYKLLGAFRQEASLHTYLQQIADHQVIEFLKERKRFASLNDLTPEMKELPPHQEALAMYHEYKQMLEKATKQLSTQDQGLYNFYYREELPVEEIAERLGCNREAVWQRISRLRKRLGKLIRKKIKRPVRFACCVPL